MVNIDVNRHSSYYEHPQGFFSAMQGRTHGVRKSGSSDVLTTKFFQIVIICVDPYAFVALEVADFHVFNLSTDFAPKLN